MMFDYEIGNFKIGQIVKYKTKHKTDYYYAVIVSLSLNKRHGMIYWLHNGRVVYDCNLDLFESNE